jgi:hypothetical protein
MGYWPFKAAREDGIFPGLLQYGIEIIMGHITNFFAACLAYGYIPLAWRAVRDLLISKAGRDSYELDKSIRSISLTSFFFENDGKAGGFLHKSGTVKILPAFPAVHDLVQKEFALGVFLDIDGSFDNASFGSMDAASMGFF